MARYSFSVIHALINNKRNKYKRHMLEIIIVSLIIIMIAVLGTLLDVHYSSKK